MKILKLLAGLAAVVVLLVVVIVVVVFTQIDAIAKRAIEWGGTYATGVETTVDSADVAILGGSFDLAGFQIANPEGHQAPFFLNIADAGVEVSLGTLTAENVELPKLEVGAIELYLEGFGSNSNYQKILDNMERLEQGQTTEPVNPEAETEAPAETQTFQIDLVTIAPTKVHFAGMPGLSQAIGDITVDVPAIELQNVGSKEPMTMPQIVSLLIKTVLAASIEASGGAIPGDILNDLQGRLGSLASLDSLGIDIGGELGGLDQVLGGDIQETVDKAKEQVDEAIGDAADQVKDRLGGLLGGGGDDSE